jgi:hypothetical protein
VPFPAPGAPPAVPSGAAAQLDLRGEVVDLRTRALVAAVVGPPRFGREGEVAAAVAAVADARADLADVSLEPRLTGSVARRGPVPVCARVASLDAAAAAHAAGVALLLVPPALAADAAGPAADGRPGAGGGAAGGGPEGRGRGRGRGRGDGDGWRIAVVVDDAAEVPAALEVATPLGAPVAFDASGLAGADAMAAEAAAVSSGARIVRTRDVRRTRRVVEVIAALLDSRRA